MFENLIYNFWSLLRDETAFTKRANQYSYLHYSVNREWLTSFTLR
jgi:hypothetical protein